MAIGVTVFMAIRILMQDLNNDELARLLDGWLHIKSRL